MAKTLVVEIVGSTAGLSEALGKAAGEVTGFSGSMRSAGAAIASVGKSLTLGLTAPLVAVGALVTKAAVDFQASMELLHTQAGVSQKAVESLSKSVLAMAGSVATTPETLSTGLYHLASQGLRGKEALDALRVAAEGAKVGQANLEDVTNALGAVLVSHVGGFKTYGQAMGELNAIVGAGDMHMQDLADAMGTGLPAKAAIAGDSLKDIGAALAVFGDNNIRGAAAGTLLNSTLRIMEAPSKAAAGALKSVGIASGQLGDDIRTGGLPKAIEDLKSHFKDMGLTAEQQMQVLTAAFGGKQAGGVAILLDQLDRLKTKEQEVGAGGQKFASDWAAYTQTAAYKMDQLGASMQAAGISIGNILLPYVSDLVNKITDAVNWFENLSGSTKDTIIGVAAFAAAIGPVVAIVGAVVTAVGGLAAAFAFIASPIGIVVAAIALLVGGMAAAELAPKQLQDALEKMGLSATTSKEIVDDLRTAFGDLKSAGEDLVAAIRDHWSTIQSVIDGAVTVAKTTIQDLENFWHTFGSDIKSTATADWNAVKQILSGAFQSLEGLVEIFKGIFHGNWGEVWQGVEDLASGFVSEIQGIIKFGLSNLELIAKVVLKGLESAFTAAWSQVKAAAAKAWSDIKHVFDGAASWFEGVGAAIIHGLENGVDRTVGGLLGMLHGVVDDIKKIPVIGELISSPSPYFIEVGQAMMQGLSIGVDRNSKTAVDSLNTTIAKVKQAMSDSQSSITTAANLLGVKTTEGIVGGIVGVQQTMSSQISVALKAAEIPALAQLADGPEIKAATDVLGTKTVQGIVDGVVGKSPTMAQQLKTALSSAVSQAITASQQAVTTAQSGFASAFSTLANSALSAFDSVTSSYVAPAQKLLDKMQLQDQVNQYKSAVQTAAASVTADQAALVAAQAGGDPATIQAAHAQLLSDQQAYSAAVRQQQEFTLQQSAAAQTKAYNTQRASQREALAGMLSDLEKSLDKHPKEWKSMGDKVRSVLKIFDVPMYASGQKWASQFADGLKSQLGALEDAAKAMADAVAKYIPRSPARTGPLAFSSLQAGQMFGADFARGVSAGLYSGAGLGRFNLSAIGATGGAAVGLGGAGINSPITVQVNAPNYLGDKSDLIATFKSGDVQSAIATAVKTGVRSGRIRPSDFGF